MHWQAVSSHLKRQLRLHKQLVVERLIPTILPVVHAPSAHAQREMEPFILLGQDEHGVSSVAMHYYLALPGFTCLIQESWGGAYTDDAAAAWRLEQHFILVRMLAERVEEDAAKPGLVIVQSGLVPPRLGVGSPGNWEWRDTATPLLDALAFL